MSDDVRRTLTDKREDLLARMAGISAAPSDSGGISFGKRVGDGRPGVQVGRGELLVGRRQTGSMP